jgi:hypothetical protein
MRGHDEQQQSAFSYRMPEERIPQNPPLRRIRVLTDAALQQLDLYFAAVYARQGDRRLLRRDSCELCCCRFCMGFAASAS